MSQPPRLWTAVISSLLAPTALAAQDAASELPWSAVLYYEAQQVAPSPDEAFWQTVTAGLQRKLPAGSIVVQALATRRSGAVDQAVAADIYYDLWPGAYGNASLNYAPDAVMLAAYNTGAEIFQGVGSSEISASYRYQRFAVADVSTFGLGFGHYIGKWYLRPRSLLAQLGDSWSPFIAFTARRYLGDDPSNSFDASVGIGKEILEVAASSASAGAVEVTTSRSRFAAVKTQHFFDPRLGIMVGATYSDYGDIPNRWGVSIGLITRW